MSVLNGDCGIGDNVGSRREVLIGIIAGSSGDVRGSVEMFGVTAGAIFGEETTTALLACVGDLRDRSDDDRARFSGEWVARSMCPGGVLCKR